jgi:hypothetical protein
MTTTRRRTRDATRRDVLNTIRRRYPHYDPIVAMVELAHHPDAIEDLSLQLACHKEVAKYCVPQLKAIEMSTEDGVPLRTRVEVTFRRAEATEDIPEPETVSAALSGASTRVIDIAD